MQKLKKGNLNDFYPPRARHAGHSTTTSRNQSTKKPQSGPKRQRKPIKKIAVKNAYSSLRRILKEFNIPCVKKTFGSGIVSVYCRSIIQLENITRIVKELLESRLIEEVGMPLNYSHKFKTLVVHLKPVDKKSITKVNQVFQNCIFEYHHVVSDVENPKAVAKESLEEKDNSVPMVNTVINPVVPVLINNISSKMVLLFVLISSSALSRI